jgi:hypothetical protein
MLVALYDRRAMVGKRSSGWTAAYVAVVALFLVAVARYYHPGSGFTFFIEFPSSGHDAELAAVHQTPHYDHPGSSGYDGQYYAQIAMDPLLRDVAIDQMIDAPYRSRRILFSWTAYAFGLGRPDWILQVFAFQNVVAWLLLAWLICRWFPPREPRMFVLWMGTLLSPGVLASVRYALPDGPSALLVAAGVALVEAGRPISSALVIGMAALGRETALLGAGVFAHLLRRDRRSWVLALGCVVLCAIPFALWFDYLRSIYRSNVFAAGSNFAAPFAGVQGKITEARREFYRAGLTLPLVVTIASLISFGAQVLCVLWACVMSPRRSSWVFAAAPFIALAAILGQPVWQGVPGAYTRVLIPLALGANAILAASPRPQWWLIGLANLGAIPAVVQFGHVGL